MPSPFPGIDPYLERGDLWLEFHNAFMVYVRDRLQPQLPEHYVARLQLRIYTEFGDSPERRQARIPDLELVRTGGGSGADPVPSPDYGADTGVEWVPWTEEEFREVYIEVRSARDDELVTSIELLSPTNKRPGEGREEYLRKQREMLRSRVNLVEMDFLRAGQHTVAAPQDRLSHARPFDYLISTWYRDLRSGFRVAHWTLREPLPKLPIPLGAEEPQLWVDLQSLYASAYDNAAFRKMVDYRAEPVPPLKPEDAAWADELLRQAGLRGETRG